MCCKISSVVVLLTYLALYHYFWTLTFDVQEKLSSCHMLIAFVITNITTEFRAIVHCMLLKLFHCLPYNSTLSRIHVTFVRELTEVNTISKNFVDVLHEISACLTIWTTNIESRCGLLLLLLLIFIILVGIIIFKLQLTIFAKQLIALFTFKW